MNLVDGYIAANPALKRTESEMAELASMALFTEEMVSLCRCFLLLYH